jgi:hypothetical protein
MRPVCLYHVTRGRSGASCAAIPARCFVSEYRAIVLRNGVHFSLLYTRFPLDFPFNRTVCGIWMKNSVRRWRFIGYNRFVDDTGTPHPTHAPRVRRPGSGGMVIREPPAMANHIEGIDSPDSPQFANFDQGSIIM